MSRRDAGTMFSQAQAITALSQASTFYIDFFSQNHQIAQAVKVPLLHVEVHDTFTGANFNFLSIYFQDANQAAGSVGPNAVPGVFENTLISILNIPKAVLTAGADPIIVSIPISGGNVGIAMSSTDPNTLSDSPLGRYVQFLYVVDGIPTTGSLDAWLDSL